MFWGNSGRRSTFSSRSRSRRLFQALSSSSSFSSTSRVRSASRRVLAGRTKMRIRTKSFFCWLTAFAIVYFVAFHGLPIQIDLRDPRFNEQDRCPSCYGQELCRTIFDDRVQLTNWTRFTAARMINSKNYFYASLENEDGTRERIILKKLAHDWEIRRLDERMCQLAKQPDSCRPGHFAKGVVNQYRVKGELDRSISLSKLKSTVRLDTELLSCARAQSLVDFLVQRFRYHPSSSSLAADESSAVDHAFALLLLGNPEPLVFAAFPQSEGWPFPRYLGACGRIAAFEDAGTRLADFFGERWEIRVGLARQLLDLTFMLSGENDLGVALYLTDWSADNFAVSASDGKLRLVDGEDLVLVDVGLVRQERAPGWDVVHHSPGCGEGSGDGTSFCYSVADLCTHAESDLNVYGACAGLLADGGGFGGGNGKGLLHGAPEQVMRKHPLLNRLLEECARPTHPGGRFEAAKEIREILKHL